MKFPGSPSDIDLTQLFVPRAETDHYWVNYYGAPNTGRSKDYILSVDTEDVMIENVVIQGSWSYCVFASSRNVHIKNVIFSNCGLYVMYTNKFLILSSFVPSSDSSISWSEAFVPNIAKSFLEVISLNENASISDVRKMVVTAITYHQYQIPGTGYAKSTPVGYFVHDSGNVANNVSIHHNKITHVCFSEKTNERFLHGVLMVLETLHFTTIMCTIMWNTVLQFMTILLFLETT